MSAEPKALSPAEEMLNKLRAVDPDILLAVVRQDQCSSSYDINEWSVRQFSNKGAMSQDGLFLFSGHGRDERSTRPWSVVLKVAMNPGEARDPQNMRYWKREMLLAQSGLLNTLPGPVLCPRFYGVTENETGGWIWMEHIRETPGPWRMDDYAFAARQAGRFNGSFLTGTALPDLPWLAKDHMRTWLNWNPEKAWDNPYVRQFFSAKTHARVDELWTERERFLQVLESLPQAFSHSDFHRRNLFIRRPEGSPAELVAIDWALCGVRAVGADLVLLAGMTAMFHEIEPTLIPDLDQAAFPGYLLGLRDVGWAGEADLIRLGFCAGIALMFGIALAPVTAAFINEEGRPLFHRLWGDRSFETIASGFTTICEFSLDRGDEARALMSKLGL